MIVVHYDEVRASHDCWGSHEWQYSTKVKEFKNMDEWLKFRLKSKVRIDFIEAWEVTKKIK